MAGIDDKQTRETIDIFPTLVVPNVVALTFDNDGHLGAVSEGPLAGEVHPEVIASFVLQGLWPLGQLFCFRFYRSGLCGQSFL